MTVKFPIVPPDRPKISPELQLPETAPSRADSWGYADGIRAAFKKKAPEQDDSASAPVVEHCPELVILVALYELCRAVVLGIVCVLALTHFHPEWDSRNFFDLFFFMSNGTVIVSWLTPISLCYALTMAIALLAGVSWSRRLLMVTSLLSILPLTRFVSFVSVMKTIMPPPWIAGPDFFREGAYVLAGLNATIVLCLLYGPGVAHWFKKAI